MIIWILLFCCLIFISCSFNFTTAFYDSILLVNIGKSFAHHGFDVFFESSPCGFGIFIPITQYLTFFSKNGYFNAVVPLLSISFALLFGFFIMNEMKRIITKAICLLFMIFLFTNQFVIFNCFLLLTNFPSAIYLTIGIFAMYSYIKSNDKCWLFYSAICLTAFGLLRTEAILFLSIVIIIFISYTKLDYKISLKNYMPVFLIQSILFYKIIPIIGQRMDILSYQTKWLLFLYSIFICSYLLFIRRINIVKKFVHSDNFLYFILILNSAR